MKFAKIKLALKIIIVAAIFYVIFRNILSNFDQLRAQEIQFNYIYVIISLFVMLLAWITTAWSWGKTLEAFGYPLRYPDVFVIYFRSMLAKYLPGKLWQIVGATYVAAQKGVPEGATIASVVIGQAYSLLAGVALCVGALALGFIRIAGEGAAIFRWTSIPVLLGLLVLIVRPNLTEPVMNWGLRLFRRQEVSLKIKPSTSFWLFWAYFVPWCLFGISFWSLAHAIVPMTAGQIIPLTAIFTAATVIGFLAIFSPGGLGVREGAIIVLMTSIAGFPVAIASALAIGFRIINTLIELLAFGITWLITWIQRRGSRR
jgi:hypothetical protein